MKPARAAIAFGSNLGDRAGHVRAALERIAALPGLRIAAVSQVRESAPEGGPAQGPYLNGVVLVQTRLSPRRLLEALLRIERDGGRVRRERDGPRTIDLDLVFHGDSVADESVLTLPHPRAHERAFVLEPLAEVAPDWTHPRLRRTALDLWRSFPGRGSAAAAAESAAR